MQDRNAARPSPDRLSPGTRLSGIYEIDELIASGGIGEVYRAHTIETGDPVAIKVLRAEFADNEAALALFKKEASALHNLHHEAIVRYFVFSVEPVLQRPYLAMEFVEGQSLSDLLRRGPLTFEAVRTLACRLAAGLQAAHERGVVHRDVSPDNVIIKGGDVGHAKIIDFGIARFSRLGDGTIIGAGFAGKFNYASPEQLGLFGGEVTGKSDIYSLALVLAESLTGRALDMGGSQSDIVEKRRKIPDLGAIDMRIRPLLERMLQPQPQDRPESMAAVAAILEGGQEPAGVRNVRDPRARGAQQRRPAASQRTGLRLRHAVALAAAIVFAASVAAVLYLARPAARIEQTAAPELHEGTGADQAAQQKTATEKARAEQTPAPDLHEGSNANSTAQQKAADKVADELKPAPEPHQGSDATPAVQQSTEKGPGEQTHATEPPENPGSNLTAEQNASTESGPGNQAHNSELHISASEANPKFQQKAEADTGHVELGPVERIERFISQYDGGECFFIKPGAISQNSASIEGYGSELAPFQTLDDAFKRTIGFDAFIGLRQVTAAQCPAITFLARLPGGGAKALQLTVADTNLRSGQRLTGSVETASPNVALLLVADDGIVHNLSGALKPDGAGRMAFSVPVRLSGADQKPQVLLAIASADRLSELDMHAPVAAATLFPALSAESARNGKEIQVAPKYFKLER